MENHKPQPKRPVKAHPKPALEPVNSLNQAIRRELWYVDTMFASPFRTMRRQLQANGGAWAQGVDEALWALEGMTRLPIKVLQSAFGEPLAPKGEASTPPSSADPQTQPSDD